MLLLYGSDLLRQLWVAGITGSFAGVANDEGRMNIKMWLLEDKNGETNSGFLKVFVI